MNYSIFLLALVFLVVASITVTIETPVDGANLTAQSAENFNFTITNTSVIDTCWYEIDHDRTEITQEGEYINDVNTIALYHANTGSGTTLVDSSSNGYDGVMAGINWETDARLGAYSINFTDSDDSYVNLTTGTQWTPTTGNLTIEMWVKPDTVSGTQMLYHIENNTGTLRFIYFRLEAATLKFRIYDNTVDATASSSVAINASEWTHVAATYNEKTTEMLIYVGNSITANTTHAGLPSINDNAELGRNEDGSGQTYGGLMDEIRISDNVRTDFDLVEGCSLNTTFTKNEVATYTINVSANDTAGGTNTTSITVTSDDEYEIRVINDSSVADENYTVNFEANGNSINLTAVGAILFFNASDVFDVMNNSVQITVYSVFGTQVFNNTITNETFGYNTTFQINAKILEIHVKSEDTNELVEGLINLTVFNTTFTMEVKDTTNMTNISLNFFGEFTVTAVFEGGSRSRIIDIDELADRTNLTMYFPDSALTYIFTVQDASEQVLEDVRVGLLRFINDSFVIVDESFTQVDGTTGIYAKESIPYLVNVTDDACNDLLFNYEFTSALVSTPIIVTLVCGEIDISGFANYFNFYNNAEWLCTNSTTEIACNVTDNAGLMVSANLEVQRRNLLNWNSVCDLTTTANPAYLNCTLTNTENATFWYVFTATIPEGDVALESGSVEFGTVAIFGTFGIFIVMLLIILMGMVGIWNPAVSLIMVGMSLIASLVFGLLPTTMLSATVGILLVIGIFAYKMKT